MTKCTHNFTRTYSPIITMTATECTGCGVLVDVAGRFHFNDAGSSKTFRELSPELQAFVTREQTFGLRINSNEYTSTEYKS